MNSLLLSLSNCANSSAWLRTSTPAHSRPSRISVTCLKWESILVFLSKKHNSTSDDWRQPELRRSKLQVLLWAYLQECRIYNCHREKTGAPFGAAGCKRQPQWRFHYSRANLNISQCHRWQCFHSVVQFWAIKSNSVQNVANLQVLADTRIGCNQRKTYLCLIAFMHA